MSGAVLDAIQEALTPTCHGHTRQTAEAVLDVLRALPVEQRMEAMGMELDTIECGEHYDGRHWVEVRRGS